MAPYDRKPSETGTHSFPELVALRLLVELRGRVGQVSAELSRRQSSGSDTLRLAVLKLSRVAHQSGIAFETARTAKLRAAYTEIRATLLELGSTARLAGLTTYAGVCERVIVQLASLDTPNDVTAPVLDVLFEWIETSIAYLGATAAGAEFPEAHTLVDCLFDPRWDGLYEFAVAEPLRDGLIRDRRHGERT